MSRKKPARRIAQKNNSIGGACRLTYCNPKQIGGVFIAKLIQPQRRLSGGQRLSRQLVRWSSGRTGSTQCLRCQVRQVEHCRFAHPAAKVAVSGFCVHQKAVWYSEKTHAPPGCGQRDLRYGCRVVRLGDLGERKKRPHLVENQISKSLKELFK